MSECTCHYQLPEFCKHHAPMLKEPSITSYMDIVFDGPPSHESGRFIEVEDETGRSVSVGQWINRGNGLWALRIQKPSVSEDVQP